MSSRALFVASAGSGKTFLISTRIIELLAADEEPAAIFASTFTRKAAGEILDRVLVRLARGASSAEGAKELARQIPVDGARGDGEDPAFWRGVLARTVRELHRLDIGTLDAFFGRVVRSFGFDLGLPPGWGIADDPTVDRVRAEALDEVLARADRGVLIELVRALHSGSVRRSVHDALARDVEGLLSVQDALVDEAPSEDAPGWEAMARAVPPRPRDLETRCLEVAAALDALPVPTKKKSEEPDSRWLKAMRAAAERIRRREWADYLKSGLWPKVREAGDDPPSYYRTGFPPGLEACLRDGAELARLDIGAELAERGRAMGRLAERYRDAWHSALLTSGQLRFDDVPRLLTLAGGSGDRRDLFYRLGGATDHLLLDEFQDTSLLQWRALSPVVDRIAGTAARPGQGVAVVVADPKQSIYGWRGAAPIVLDAVRERTGLIPDHLATSFRSSEVVLDAVNSVFEDIHTASVVADDAVDAEIARRWGEDFTPHREDERSEGHPKPGQVAVEVGPEKTGRTAQHPEMCNFAAERVAELRSTHPGRSIGVLTRTNATVARIIHELGRLNVPASEEGGTRLTDSGAVVSVLALLRMTDHPGHGLARYHVATTPVGEALDFTDPGNQLRADALAGRIRRDLLDHGYGATLRGLARDLEHAFDPRDASRMDQLVQLGYRFDGQRRGGARVDDFVRLARATTAEAPGHEQIRVMTIHGSKGLEFDLVVLPELHHTMFGRSDSGPISYRPEGHGRVTHAFPSMASDVADLFRDVPRLPEAREQARAASVRDALGGVYVAMTRARHALHMLVPADGAKVSSALSPARLIRERLVGPPEEVAAEEGTVWSFGDEDWHHRAAPPDGGPAGGAGRGAAPLPERIELRRGARTRMVERRTPSSDASGHLDLAVRLGRVGSGSRDRGTVVHAWLEAVEWLDRPLDELLDPDTRLRVARRAVPGLPEDRAREWFEGLGQALEAPEVRAVLDRAQRTEAAATLVEREIPFLLRTADALYDGSIDRLVIETDAEGTPLRAEVLDWKTDHIAPGDEAALQRQTGAHAPQLRRYAQAVQELYGLPVDRISARLVFLEAGEVREVSSGPDGDTTSAAGAPDGSPGDH